MSPRPFHPLMGALLACALGAGAEAQESPPPPPPPVHSFWDTTNLCLFAGVAASRGLDYASTRDFRSRGFKEVLLTNSIVDNRPLFISIEIAGTALSIGVSRWLHSHHHHRLERAVSVIHIGVTTFGAVRNYNLGKH